jgi:hypothetical protein
VNFGLFTDQDTTRYCFLRLRRLKAALKDATIIDALVDELEVPGATGNKRLAAIERRIEELRGTNSSIWHQVPAPEVLAASIFRARKRIGEIDKLFAHVPRVRDLTGPLVSWLNISGLTPYQLRAPGTGRASMVGYKDGGFLASVRIVGIEAVNDPGELKRATDEMKTSRAQGHARFIACTPALAAAYLWEQATAPGASRWNADDIRQRLRATGTGLLIVEGEAVAQALLPQEHKPDSAKLAELATAIQSMSKIQSGESSTRRRSSD